MGKWTRFFLVANLALFALPALAQRPTASLRGTVTDPTGAVTPGVSVTLTGEDTGFKRSTTTNGSGLYSFTDLPVGNYRMDVELAGFKKESRSKIVLNVADVRALDIRLATGDITEQVSVEVPAIAVQTVGGDMSGLVTGEQVRELPLNGRNFLQLAVLMPGVVAADFLNVKDKGLLGGSDISVSGSDVTANLWTVDGANNNDVGSNRTILVYPSVEAIEEFKIHRNNYGAEFGQSAGAQINLVTRGGTNEFHGSGFYSGRRDSLASIDHFLDQAGQPKQKLNRNDFGWTFGGPIIKDKLHFFASQEWNREERGSVRTAFVPTQAERNGDFSGPTIDGCSSPVPVDPATGQAFPGNVIPANRQSPGGQLFLQLYPQPNSTPTGGNCSNWVASLNSPVNWRQENLRMDWTISNTSRLMVRYTQDHWENGAPNLYNNLWGDDPFPAVDSNWSQPGKSLIVQLNKNIGTTAVNTLTFSYSANKIEVTRGGTTPDLNNQINAAIPTVFPDAIREYGADRGHPVFWGGQGYGDALWNEAPFNNNQDLFVLKDDYSAVFGKHFFKAGVLASTNKKNEDVLGYGSSENSEFWGSTGLQGTDATTGNILADFLLKDMTFGFDENSAQRQVPQRWKDLEFYAGDSWKMSPRVTLDYGLRYSRFFNPYADDNKIMNFQPSLFNPALGADACNGLLQPEGTNWCQDAGFAGGTQAPDRSLYEQDKNMLAPRLGVAWDVHGDGKTAIRAGVGQFFLRERLAPGLNIGNNPPFVINLSGTRTLDSAAPPCADCFSSSAGVPNAGREVKALTPNSWQWNLTFQHEILKNTILELSYVGSKGTHMLRTYDANQVLSGDINGNGIDDRLEYARSIDAAGEVRPFGVFGDHKITFWDHSGSSIYHGLQTQVQSRFGHSQVQASYTFSRTISNMPLDNSDGGLSDLNSITDIQHPELDRGLARTHRKHVFNASAVLELPTLDDKSGLTKHLFGNWQFGTVVLATSGAPLTVLTGTIPELGGGPSGTGFTNNQRANRVSDQPCRASGGSDEQILNPAGYTLDGFQLGTIGTAGHGDCEGPGFFQVDMSLYKNIKLSEKVRMQLRFEVFNVFNRVNYLSYTGGGYAINTTMNPISDTFDNAAAPTTITHAEIPSDFGRATSARDPRQAQFGIKLIF